MDKKLQIDTQQETGIPAEHFIIPIKDLEQSYPWRIEESILFFEDCKRLAFSFQVWQYVYLSKINVYGRRRTIPIPSVETESKTSQGFLFSSNLLCSWNLTLHLKYYNTHLSTLLVFSKQFPSWWNKIWKCPTGSHL